MENESKNPACIGVIMDGNRRFARERGLSVLEGHKAGYEKLKELLGWAKEEGIKHVIAYAFSTENWKRTEEEIGYLMSILRFALGKEIGIFQKEKTKLKFIGELSRLPKDIQEKIKEAEKETAGYDDTCLIVAISYGGRAEILSAVKKIAELDKKEIENLSEVAFGNYLWTAGIPDPDLIIRTSGEKRLSNFLLWQGAYSELFFVDEFWPAFSKENFKKILTEFSLRKRRLGK